VAIRVVTGNPVWDEFAPTIEEFLRHDRSEFIIDGRRVGGYRSPDTTPIWLRDHTHQMKGFKYFDPDVTSALDIFCQAQMPDGSFYDLFVDTDGIGGHDPAYHRLIFYDAINRIFYQRTQVEADVEYLAVEAVHGAWQATGDDEWMRAKLPHLERGLAYSMRHPHRWSPEYQLVKRDFTIDTWDFAVGPIVVTPKGRYHRSEIDENSLWCIMHGDNSGMYLACKLMARMYAYLGHFERATHWQQVGEGFRQRTNQVCWNGTFYTHQVHITPVNLDVDESRQLSLSNTYDMNRGLPGHGQCVSIIQEYQRRRETLKETHFAEWLSIDPPFPPEIFGGAEHAQGRYVNGGIMPLVGGELARASFEHGFESYGVDILKRYYELAIEPEKTYLWYQPDGMPASGGDILPTDGWGSAAMLYAFVEGLAGVVDQTKGYGHVRLSPRWRAAEVDDVEVEIGYAASGATLRYTWKFDNTTNKIELDFSGPCDRVDFHVLVPKPAKEVTLGGQTIDFANKDVEQSHYVDFSLRSKRGNVVVKMK